MEIVKIKGIRGLIAHNMRKSLRETAQLTFRANTSIERLSTLRRMLVEGEKTQASIEDFLVKVLADQSKLSPIFAAKWTGDNTLIMPEDSVDVSVAIAAKTGLVTPAIFAANKLSVYEISEQRKDLVARASTSSLTHKELTGGNITLSNLGKTRVQGFTPILNYPQVAILGIAAGDGVNQLSLNLTVDHAVIDGKPASDFLTGLCEAIEGAVF